MSIYARPGRRMLAQLVGDVLLVAWIAAWAWAGRALQRAVLGLAVPARQSGNLAAQMAGQMQRAQDELGQVPGVGGTLSSPFGSLRDGLGQLVQLSQDQVVQVHRVALAAGWACFLVPAVTGLVVWLPRRIRFVRQARLTQRFVDADEDLELFALRGMANLPMPQIARISSDPVGDWRRGDRHVIRALAAQELDRIGLDVRGVPTNAGKASSRVSSRPE